MPENCETASSPTLTAASQQLPPLNELAAVIPLLASAFAFSYVVGYFLAFDLAWFSFFSLSEHVVFALRALPVAAAALVALLIAARNPLLLSRAMRIWFVFLIVVAAPVALLSNHPGIFMSFVVIAIGAYRIPETITITPSAITPSATISLLAKDRHAPAWRQLPSWFQVLRRSSATTMTSTTTTMLYLVPQLMVMSLMLGWVSGLSWKIDSLARDLGWHLPLAEPPMHVHLVGEDTSSAHLGHVIFVGNLRVLVYEYGPHKVLLYKSDQIQQIHEDGLE
jgi:hypothetical protein